MGSSSYDITHFVSWATLYELPFGKGKRWLNRGPASWILGNWQSNFIAQARSGAPYNMIVTGDLANLGGSASTQGLSTPNNYLRPNLIADPFVAGPVAANPDPLCQKTISQGGRAADQVRTIVSWFNPCAFGVPDKRARSEPAAKRFQRTVGLQRRLLDVQEHAHRRALQSAIARLKRSMSSTFKIGTLRPTGI